MARRRIIIVTFLSLLLVFGIFVVVKANKLNNVSTSSFDTVNFIDPTTNFFTQPVDKTLVELDYSDEELYDAFYTKICENESIVLYLHKKTMGIAIYDKVANYIWYSCYKDYKSSGFNDSVKEIISSGVNITCYDSQTLNEVTKYSSNTKDCEMEYEIFNNGFLAHLSFKTVGISFDVEVTIDGNKLNAKCLFETLKEEPYQTKAMKYPKEYKLQSVALFPYLGSENYNINAYAFIPDGSGALIKYTDISYDTAYIKRVYGDDYGVQNNNTKDYLKNVNNITLPIYGINHGYNQASVLVEIKEGYGSSELHAYPYNYENITLNRTFFKYICRDKFNIAMASSTSGNITIINSDLYNDIYSLSYTFLNNENSGYIGMANEYKKQFDLNNNSNSSLKLDVVAQDYKNGLFGKNYIVMTSYKELLNILKELKSKNVKKIEVNYIGFNKNGFFDNTLTKIKLDPSLGSKKDYKNLINYAKDNDIEFYYYSNPLVATKSSTSKKTIKKLNLEIFDYDFNSSLDLTGKLINPNYLSNYFLKYKKQYSKLEMNNFSFEYVGEASFSYRYKSSDYSRDEMIKILVKEIETISNKNYKLALSKPNAYLYNYINSYYDAFYESSKYSFITDSIPFISLILSGSVSMYSPSINFVSDYNLFALRCIEYDINPSYVITNNETSDLRFCNFEYLYTTEYDLMNENIINMYNKVNNALDYVSGKSIINHEYISYGVCKVSYENGVDIYINYTESDVNISGNIITPMNYLVIGGEN